MHDLQPAFRGLLAYDTGYSTMDQLRYDLAARLPSILGAITLLILGVFVAYVVAAAVRWALAKTTFDDRLVHWLRGGSTDETIESERWFARVVFWIIVAFALIGFFQVLDVQAVTLPLTAMLTKAVGFIPNLFAAGVLLVLAWILATGLRYVVVAALRRTGIDERVAGHLGHGPRVVRDTMASRMAGTSATPAATHARPHLSDTLGTLAYWLVFLLFLPLVLDALRLHGLMGPVASMFEEVLVFLPKAFVATVLLVVAWFIAQVLGRLVSSLLVSWGFDGWMRRQGLVTDVAWAPPPSVGVTTGEPLSTTGMATPAVAPSVSVPEAAPVTQTATPSVLAGQLVRVTIMLFAAQAALELLNLAGLAVLIHRLLAFMGSVALGVIVIAVGVWLANLAARLIRASGVPGAGVVAAATRIAIIVLVVAMGVETMGVGHEILRNAVSLLIAGVALAIGLAFGLGGRDVADGYLRRWTGRAEAARRDSAP